MQQPSIFALNRRSEMRPSFVHVGPYPILIVDNVYRDPHAVREHALRKQFATPRARFPGYEASTPGDPSFLAALVGSCFGVPLAADPDHAGRIVFSMIDESVSTRLRTQGPHIDWQRHVSLILYLNLPDQCRGGTSFYRHRDTRLVSAPTRLTPRLREVMKREGLATAAALLEWILKDPPLRRATGLHLEPDPHHWELVQAIAMQWNRLIAFPGLLFHTAAVTSGMFSSTKSGRRLTQTCFVHPVDGGAR